jgi:hypothetical protein
MIGDASRMQARMSRDFEMSRSQASLAKRWEKASVALNVMVISSPFTDGLLDGAKNFFFLFSVGQNVRNIRRIEPDLFSDIHDLDSSQKHFCPELHQFMNFFFFLSQVHDHSIVNFEGSVKKNLH